MHVFCSKSAFFVLLASLFIALSGCTGPAYTVTPVPVDRSFLTDEPCAAPCWYDLVPGKSTKADMHRVLAELPFVNQKTIGGGSVSFAGERAVAFSFYCPNRSEKCGWIIVQDSIVQEIGSGLQYTLTFGEVVEKLGPPDYVWVRNWGDTSGYSVDLYYVQRGIIVSRLKTKADRHINWSDGSVVLAEEMEATSLVYFPPASSLRDDLASRGVPSDRIEYLLEHLPTWPGWGEPVSMGP